MPNTAGSLALPYPAATAAPDVPYDIRQLAEAVEAKLSNRPKARIVASAATQSTTTGVVTTVDFAGGTETYDNDNMGDIANDQIVIKTAGYYSFKGRVAFASAAAGYRALLIYRNGVEVLDDEYVDPVDGQATVLTLHTEPILCAVNDAISLRTLQTSGGNLNLQQQNGRGAILAASWHGGQ